MTKMMMRSSMANSEKRVKNVRTVLVVAVVVAGAEAAVEGQLRKNLVNRFAKKFVQPPAPGVPCATKMTWMMMTTTI